MYADMHIHSIFSDSSRSPEEIAHVAKKRNVSLLSVCDHGTVAAYERLAEACGQIGVSVVLGIEMGAVMGGHDYHMLAYNFDWNNNEMADFIRSEVENSDRECEAMIVKMSGDYPQLSLADYLAYERPEGAGGWKYIHYAVDRGVYKTYEEAGAEIFPLYYEAGEAACPVEEFCRIVKQAGGAPVLAHPGNIGAERFTELLRGMQDRGLAGVECYYPSHSKETTEFLADYCRKNNLRITGGSDCHGDYDRTPGYTIGSLKTPACALDLKGII